MTTYLMGWVACFPDGEYDFGTLCVDAEDRDAAVDTAQDILSEEHDGLQFEAFVIEELPS